MNIEDTLNQLLTLASSREEVRSALLLAAEGPNPVSAVAREAEKLGYPFNEMDLISAGEDAYAAMRRSTNGGGENSPLLRGEDDYFELFLAKLRETGLREETHENVIFLRQNDLPGAVPPGCVGVFDSGVGGISVLGEIARLMPEEQLLYIGDSANAPYGNKTEEWVRERSFALTKQLLELGAKAVVIACNTATAAAVAPLREAYPDLPVIGVEPALKVAVNRHDGNSFLVMATNVTLNLNKYHALEHRLETEADFYPLACDGLAARIEQGNLDGEDLADMLEGFLLPYIGTIDGIVLGCTHYPLVRRQIREIVGDLPLYDGGEGTAREVRRRLAEAGLTAPKGQKGLVILSSTKDDPEQEALYRWFFSLAGELQ